VKEKKDKNADLRWWSLGLIQKVGSSEIGGDGV
jgi:hypothetical protein